MRRLILHLLALSSAVLALRAGEMAEPAPIASRSLLLGIARAGDRLVAVGSFGVVLVSADEGRSWSQVVVPARAMLTAVTFVDTVHGWAVGHDGVVLATADGAASWQRQDSGRDLDAVFFDVLFSDAQTGFAVGAYGRFAATEDGGQTWTARKPTDEDMHFNRLTAGPDGRLYLAGESGTLLASADRGRTWRKLAVPYEGSLYGVVPVSATRLVVYGLRGHILRSDDAGASWTALDSDLKINLAAGLRLRDGTIVLGGQGGHFFVSRDGGGSFAHWKPADFGAGIADLEETTDGALLAVGEAGAVRLVLPKP